MNHLNAREEIDFSPSPSSYLDEYQKLVIQLNDTPVVIVDNAATPTTTLIKIDTVQKPDTLLHTVQTLTDLNLSITKAYISSDVRWSMNVFHVTDHLGRKLSDTNVLSLIQQSLARPKPRKPRSQIVPTTLELNGADRPGILSEIFAVLADLDVGVSNANVWTHNGRIASLISTGGASSHRVEEKVRQVLSGEGRCETAYVSVHAERRLHQLMFEDRDFARGEKVAPSQCVSVNDWAEKGYSVVGVRGRDRPRLLFDVVCTLTDMGYMVFHGTVNTERDSAHQEFYIRHLDGSPISSEAERQRVIQCLQAATDRRSYEGLRLELRARDRKELLADVTRTFRENGLLVRRAEVSTQGRMSISNFYVTDASDQKIDFKTIDNVRKRIPGAVSLQVKDEPRASGRYMKVTEDWSDTAKKGTLKVGLLYLMKNLWG